MPRSDVTAEGILRLLNPPQRDAVTATTGPVLVVAGAGSGKTRVIAHRIAYLLGVEGVDPRHLLAVTFTNKAAEEMRRRVEELVLPAGIRPPLIATFHSTCVRILRQRAAPAGLPPSFVIYDEEDRLGVVKEAMRELDFDERALTPASAVHRISHAKNQMLSPEEVERLARTPREERVAALYRLSEQRLRAAGAVDFDDLLLRVVHLFETAPEALAWYRALWTHVLVDEYQDTNRAQYRIIQLLTHERRNLCVVGDPDQSVYRWRGADLRNILDFEKDYPDCRVVTLEQNYRSTKRILDIASAVIANNTARKDKRLWTDNGEGERASVYRAWDENEEAAFVAQSIRALRREGVEHRDIAVFYRTNAQSRVLEDALRRASVPYLIVGGVRFYERREIKDIVAYLRLVVNPLDDAADRRVGSPPREPGGAGRRLRGVHRQPGGLRRDGREARELPRFDRAGGRHRRDRSRGGRRHADDAALGQGARVPRGVPHRDGGGRLPALALDGGSRGTGGGAAPLLRRDHARQAASRPLLRAPSPHPGLRGRRALALPARDPGVTVDAAERARGRARAPAGRPRRRARPGGRLSLPPGRQAAPCALGRRPTGRTRALGGRGDRDGTFRQRRAQAPLTAVRAAGRDLRSRPVV